MENTIYMLFSKFFAPELVLIPSTCDAITNNKKT